MFEPKRLIPPEPGASRRWRRVGVQYVRRGWPGLLLIIGAFYGGSALFYRLGNAFGASGLLVAEGLTILLSGPVFYWIAIASVAQVHNGGRGLFRLEELCDRSMLLIAGKFHLITPVIWMMLWGGFVSALGPELLMPLSNRPAMAIGVAVMFAGAYPALQNLRLARTQYLGVDGGLDPADLSFGDRMLLMIASHKITGMTMAPILLVYLPPMFFFPPLAILTLVVAYWIAAVSYVAVVELYGGDSAPQWVREEAPDLAPSPISS